MAALTLTAAEITTGKRQARRPERLVMADGHGGGYVAGQTCHPAEGRCRVVTGTGAGEAVWTAGAGALIK